MANIRTFHIKLEKALGERRYLRQGNAVRQVASLSTVLQRFHLCPLQRNGNENLKVIQNPGFLPDHAQNGTTGSLCHARHTLRISERSVHNFLGYLVHTHTDRQTKTGKNITSLAEVKILSKRHGQASKRA